MGGLRSHIPASARQEDQDGRRRRRHRFFCSSVTSGCDFEVLLLMCVCLRVSTCVRACVRVSTPRMPGNESCAQVLAPSIRAKYIGVWRKAQGPWRASLFKGENGQKRTVHLGSFSCAMTAGRRGGKRGRREGDRESEGARQRERGMERGKTERASHLH